MADARSTNNFHVRSDNHRAMYGHLYAVVGNPLVISPLSNTIPGMPCNHFAYTDRSVLDPDNSCRVYPGRTGRVLQSLRIKDRSFFHSPVTLASSACGRVAVGDVSVNAIGIEYDYAFGAVFASVWVVHSSTFFLHSGQMHFLPSVQPFRLNEEKIRCTG